LHKKECESPALDTGLSINAEPGRGRKLRIKVWHRGALLHSHTLDPHDATERVKLAKAITAKACQKSGPDALTPEIAERELLALAEGYEADVAARQEAAQPIEYKACLDDDPELYGLCKIKADGSSQRISNFIPFIQRDVRVHDDQKDERRFEGVIVLDGSRHEFTISASDFADAGKFRAMVYAVVGARARFIGKPEVIRDAASSLSKPEQIARTTATGWTRDAAAYLTPTGVVDRDGFRPYEPGELRVDVGTDGPSRGLGLMRLEPDILQRVKRHLVEGYLGLHDRAVMFTVLGAVVLAILERFAGCTQRPAVWLRGLTGSGKSFLAKLAMNFFGDYPLDNDALFVGWVATANYIERAGYYFRDALYLVDDYKPELVSGTQAVRVMQAYADGTGRGRLGSDSRPLVTRPIRGLLLSTGEDLPQNNASALARMIIVDVPNRSKEIARGRRCLEFRSSYRGVTADFIRWLIAEGRTAGFAERVERHRELFYKDITGRQNDARIASNFALLAAAVEEFAEFMGDAWPSREAQVRDYVEQDLLAMRDQLLGIAREQQASEIFLNTLRTLLAYKKVRFQDGLQKSLDVFPGDVIGKVAGEFYEVSIPLARAAVQEQLKRQGRDLLKISDAALIQDLQAAGKLIPPPTKGGSQGEKSHSVRVDGRKLRCVRIPKAELGDEDVEV
jgi:hypothetical protein